MKKKFLFFFLCLGIGFWAQSQSLSPDIIASGGDISNSSALSLEWTLGELMVTTNQTRSGNLTEGFHQPFLNISELPEIVFSSDSHDDLHSDLKVDVWPNPVHSIVNFQLESDTENQYFLECFDIRGGIVTSKTKISPSTLTKIDLDQYPSGMYFLKLSNEESDLIKTFIINKQ